ncbi:PDDEXK nuclease domain-containing protein [Algoriphagus sp. AGSA1]|uniref:PDDEXK nuclease domain-containing protein n=1 Tax=Algoriphagus sp. AGSA1 TaxID=2907213 RepID=UPI001F2DE30C|nr:PDDEXK nuclease domain-containing protein [Algoriphagus sp. AGSA1]MCE7058118.1 PDDEXK nuclease domain-containing protein [Algoriphagus sp. AGSA1]
MENLEIYSPELYSDVCQLIDGTRSRLASVVNEEVCLMNWLIGKRIKEDVLYSKRAEYGKEIIKNLATQLTERYGKGWSDRKLLHCIRAAYTFTEDEIVYAVRIQLTWTHLRSLMFIDDDLKRSFYLEMAHLEHWDTRTLDRKIDGMLYERTALSRKPKELIRQELDKIKTTHSLTPDAVFRSSYFLDILGLADTYSERDLEDAILLNLQSFIKEMGNDFAFLDRQKRITVDAVDYRIDLLFYHRSLRRLVAIDLKLGKFKPEHEGQMLLYLRYLNKNERKEGEESPIGLILCSEGNTEHIEYLMLEDGDIKVAQYFTQLPDKKILSEKLHRAIAVARENQSKE